MPPIDVSVVVAAYNAADSLPEAVASTLDQGVSIEVVIVDDASTDDTLAVARAIADPRVAVHAMEANGGPGAARNRAIEESRGAYVAVLDADDVFLPGRLKRLVECAEASRADIVIDNVLVEREDAPPEPLIAEPQLAAMREMDLATYIAGNHPFARNQSLGYAKPFFRREMLDRLMLRYDASLRIGEDYLLMADALAGGARCAVEPSAGYLYRRREGSISARLAARHVAAMKRADEDFALRHTLDANARRALAERTRALDDAAAFIDAVDALKENRIRAALARVVARPGAAWHFRYPIAARLKRLRGELRAKMAG
ncbi:glycosyltransferase [Acuticoccus sp. M5D2P5]|uniref:glycosyltransferase family 2 protein n=1 Tax=Acuticoccus kalidii TaxID=2910977 RepID=UPI001F4449BD|nr:glycosyltransferase family 2 protein [Acuticoccus kalidii]MCF3931925.1 glycosyltransferase [Acuticoccus kalidii]